MDPYHLLWQGGQFYLIGYSHERDDVRVFRVSRIRGKVGYASKAEHDFSRPEDFDPREYAGRADWQLGDTAGSARVWISERVAWLVERHFGHAGQIEEDDDGVVFTTDYADARQVVSWVLGLGERARILEPPELVEELEERLSLVIERHKDAFETAAPARRRKAEADEPDPDGKRETPIRPERFARLITLARILIGAARDGRAARRAATSAISFRSPSRSCARTSTCSTS